MIQTKVIIYRSSNDRLSINLDTESEIRIEGEHFRYTYGDGYKDEGSCDEVYIVAEDDGVKIEDEADLLRYCGLDELSTEELIKLVTANIRDLLLYKNRKYGDSALKPIRIFADDTADVSITIRMDDKLSRIINSSNLSEKEKHTFTNLFHRVLRDNIALRKNDIADLSGYLILLACAKGWADYDDQKD